jgi:4-carboxymuconolactone decarboxylase
LRWISWGFARPIDREYKGANILDKEVIAKTKKTASLYFKDVDGERPFELWSAFDKDLARDLSLFITGRMYAREKLPHPTRQLITVAALTVLSRPDELKLHIQAALNVGCTPADIAETIFQTAVYGGVPATNAGLKILRRVLQAKDLWPLDETNAKAD